MATNTSLKGPGRLIKLFPLDVPADGNILLLRSCSVLRPSEAVRHAPQAPAWLHLPASRPPEEGSPVHPHPAHLPRAALGHQDITRCYRFPHDGQFTNTFAPFLFLPLTVHNIVFLLLVSPGSGSGLRQEGPGPVLLQSRAQLPGWLNARVEEEKPRRRLQEDRRGSLDGSLQPRWSPEGLKSACNDFFWVCVCPWGGAGHAQRAEGKYCWDSHGEQQERSCPESTRPQVSTHTPACTHSHTQTHWHD